MFKSASRSVSAALLSFALAACGSGGNIGTDTGTPNPGGGGTTVTPVFRMGTLSGSTFTPNAIQVANANLGVGGSTSLKVDVVDTANGNALVTSTRSVTFASPCSAANTALITSPVVTSGGSATSTYQARGCSGIDTITATATAPDGSALQATGSVTVQSAPLSAIQFRSTTPNAIRIRGTGAPETSVVVFSLTNNAGGPAPNVPVNFSLDTTVGGITLTPATATSDANGLVQTTVRSGTVQTSVRVTASVVTPAGISPAQSDSLVISTALADQDSFSLSVGCFNIEGGDIDGTQTSVTLRAADRFNNPVPDGTAIAFRSEGGSIAPQCSTTGGACSVQFTSQNPRVSDHRVTLLATAIGEESFTDINGDGRYDSGESFTDLGEAFIDSNESGARDGGEVFVDFNSSGTFNAPSGNFTGVLCDSGCDTATSLNVRAQSTIIMSGSTAVISTSPTDIDLSGGGVQVLVNVGDNANQPMAGGTTISAATSVGTVVGSNSFTQPCTTEPGAFSYGFFLMPPTGTTPASGVFTVTVRSPSGTTTVASVPVRFSGTPPTTPPPAGNLGSIKFISADPTTIGLQGSGLDDTSTVQFQVVSDTGVPIQNQQVSFVLSTTVGGITFTPGNNGITDSSGLVTAIVKSGTVHTSVRLTATATNGSKTVSAPSSTLTITTGLPDQNSVSLSLSNPNPEGFMLDGTEVTATIRAADRFNNPVPDGTAFAFTTSGGAIGGDCVTVTGACSVIWRSQNPRTPRVAILAYAIGEESFTDLNGDGRYDDGEPFGSLAEPFRDDDLDGVYDAASEEFQDFNGDGLRTDPNTVGASGFESTKKFTGTLCDGPNNCDTAKNLYVSDTVVLTMSGSASVIDLCPPTTDVSIEGGSFTNPTCTTPSNGSPTVTIDTQDTGNGGGQTANLRIVVRDANDQPMPSGTTISLTNEGGDITITPSASYMVPQTIDASPEGNTFTWSLTDEVFVSGDQFGALTLTVTVPSGRSTIYQIRLVLNDVTP